MRVIRPSHFNLKLDIPRDLGESVGCLAQQSPPGESGQ